MLKGCHIHVALAILLAVVDRLVDRLVMGLKELVRKVKVLPNNVSCGG
jgi:hypothetical protein